MATGKDSATRVDRMVQQLTSRKEILQANPRSMEILEEAIKQATKLARLEHRRQLEVQRRYTIGPVSDGEDQT